MDKKRVLENLRQRLAASEGRPAAFVRAPDAGASPQDLMRRGAHEILGAGADRAAAFAVALAAAASACADGRPLFLICAACETRERGLPYALGLAPFGIDPAAAFTVVAEKEKALLWAAEEAVSSPGTGAVILALGVREKLYGFAVSRRLKLRQEAAGAPLYVLRHASPGREATAAAGRWRVFALPSASPDGALIGPPCVRLALERCAGLPPQQWEMEFDAPHGFRLAAPLSDRPRDADSGRKHRAA